MIVEELVSKLGLEIDEEAYSTFEKFQHFISHGMHALGFAAGAAALGFAALIGETAETAIRVGHVAEILDMSAERLGELKFAADRSEVSFEGLTVGLKHLGRTAAEAAAGSTEMAKAFSGIQIRGADGKIKPVAELLDSVAEKFNSLPTAAEKLELVTKIFGRSGPELVPFLKNLEEGIKRAREFGTVFSKEDVEGAKVFIEGTKDIRDSLIGLRNALAVPFLEPFGHAFSAIAHVIASARPYVAKFGLGIRQVGAEFRAILSPVGKFVSEIVSLFSNSGIAQFLRGLDTFSALKALMLGLAIVAGIFAVEMVASAVATLAAWLAAIAPFVLLATLIGLIVDDIYNFIEGNDSMIGRIQKWATLVNKNDHPLIVFLKEALGLLMDFTDPKHWERFKKAAGDAADYLKEQIRVGLGGKKFTTTNPYAFGQLVPEDYKPQAPAQGGVLGQGGVMDQLFGQYKPNQGAPAPSYTGPSGIHLGPPGSGVIMQQNTINVNASGMTPEQGQQMIEGALQSTYQKTHKAVGGGSQ